jgi:O-antigen/teichoic acid export membrane protein
MKPLMFFGGWLTVSSFIGPSMVAIDRFMIGAFVSLSAVTLYATPYEAVTKLTVFPASLLAVLFPAFSAMSVDRARELRKLYFRAIKYLLVLVAPPVGVVLALAYELLSWWVTPGFAEASASVAQWLAVGILVNVLSYVPVTVLQGVGRADVVSKLLMAQLPLYAVTVWYMVDAFGIIGVAVSWAAHMALATVVLLIAADRLLPASTKAPEEHFFWTSTVVVCGSLLIFLGVGLFWAEAVVWKVVATIVFLIVFVLWEWFHFLGSSDRAAFVQGARVEKLFNRKTTSERKQK